MEEVLRAGEAHYQEVGHEGLPEIVIHGSAIVRLVKSPTTHAYETALQHMIEVEYASCAGCGDVIYDLRLRDADAEEVEDEDVGKKK